VNDKTLQEKLARSKGSKRSSLRQRDDNHHFRSEDQQRDAFNKGTTFGGDSASGID
jgi:hypothetical protein